MDRFSSEAGQKIRGRDGKGLAGLLAVPLGPRPKGNGTALSAPMQQLAQEVKGSRASVTAFYITALRDEQLGALVGNIAESIACLAGMDFPAAYKHQLAAFNAALEFFALKETDEQPDTTWIIPVLKRVADDMRRLADLVSLSFPYLAISGVSPQIFPPSLPPVIPACLPLCLSKMAQNRPTRQSKIRT